MTSQHSTQHSLLFCFNPCFAGSIEMTLSTQLPSEGVELFQSLFCWIYRDDITDTSLVLAFSNGFNPCFAGSIEMTCEIRQYSIIDKVGFNPCFAGSIEMTFSRLQGRTPQTRSFNPCFAGSIEMTRCPAGLRDRAFRFQSLFCWIYRDDSGRALGRSCRSPVSILVLLDLSR